MVRQKLADATAIALIASAIAMMNGVALGQTETRSTESVTTNTIDSSGNRTETTRTEEHTGQLPAEPPHVVVERSTTTTAPTAPPPPAVNETTRTTTTTTTTR